MIKITENEEGTFNINENSWCEHCGDLEPYDLTYTEGTCWCEHCFKANPGSWEIEDPTEEEWKELNESERIAKIKYFTNRLVQLSGENKYEKFYKDIVDAVEELTEEYCNNCTCFKPCGSNDQETMTKINKIIDEFDRT